MTGTDVLEYLLVGASAVEVGTANFVDPETTTKIIEDLEKYCEDNRIEKIETLIGSIKK
jgi:dihydroorotate dehydrogenase (NAD+) catalytic subunit